MTVRDIPALKATLYSLKHAIAELQSQSREVEEQLGKTRMEVFSRKQRMQLTKRINRAIERGENPDAVFADEFMRQMSASALFSRGIIP